MNTIAFANHKGGVGKTTACMLIASTLASTLATKEFSVAVIDLDSQGSAYLWAETSNGRFPAKVYAATAETLASVLAGLDVDLILLDCPPCSTAPETLAALDVADLVVIPCTPSGPDYWATFAMNIAADIRRPGLPCLVVVNQAGHTNLSSEMEGHIRTSWKTAKVSLGSRVVYKQAAANGLGLRQLEGRPNTDALAELDALSIEILALALERK